MLTQKLLNNYYNSYVNKIISYNNKNTAILFGGDNWVTNKLDYLKNPAQKVSWRDI